jgi:hypothetical protein
MLRGRKASAALVFLTALLIGVGISAASTPPNGSVTVPASAGQTVMDSWTGSIPAGSNPTSDCDGIPDALIDHHQIQVNVPVGIYSTLKAQFAFSISWTPGTPTEDTADEILTVIGPDGNEVGSSDGGSTTETVAAENLPGGTYDVEACGFVNAQAQPYAGKLVVTTSALEGSLASAPAQGLQFSAAVPADAQRDESEPLMEVDKAGNVYTCGPTGFSQGADYAQVSTDGGDQFHLLGAPPRGQQSAAGGGDCGIATALAKNSQGNFQYAYAGLGALSGFTTSTSPDNGHSIATAGGDLAGGVTTHGVGADRQWLTYIADQTVLMSYNQTEPHDTVVIKSTDDGLTYGPTAVVGAPSTRFPGPMHYDPVNHVAFFAWDRAADGGGDSINLSISKDGGTTWTDCRATVAPANSNGFVVADSDSAGNIYVAYGEQAAFHTYLVTLRAANVSKCNNPVVSEGDNPTNNPGFSTPVQVDRNAVRTTVFPWLTAEGAPGRVAVAFYGTESDGNANSGTFKASWDVYVNQSLNALSTDPANPPTFSQVKATTHPFHYDSICLNGLACDLAVPAGDRTLADFFAIDYNPVSKKLAVVFNRTNKKPDESLGHVATPMVATQTAGPTNGGGTLGTTPSRPVVRTSSTDPTGDALSSYSLLAPLTPPPAPPTTNEPAADFTSVSVGPEIDLVDGSAISPGGFTVTMKVADLSTTSLTTTAARAGSSSLLWLFRFTNGYQDAAASARWNAAQGFTFGFNDYALGSTPCESTGPTTPSEKCVIFPGGQPIQGDVDQSTGTIRLSVPAFLLRGLTGPTGNGQRPSEVPAAIGTRFYDAEAISVGNASATQDLQSFLYPLDNTPAMDFLLPGGGGGGGGAIGCKITGGGSIAGTSGGEGKFSVNAHATGLKGQNAYRDAGAGVDFRSTQLLSVTCSVDSKQGTINGAGFDGNNPVTFTIDVVDNGEPGKNDTFKIALSDGYSNGPKKLLRGNIQVHS